MSGVTFEMVKEGTRGILATLLVTFLHRKAQGL